MKKTILLTLLCLVACNCWAKKVTIDGVVYELLEYTTSIRAEVFKIDKNLEEVTIRGAIEHDGKVFPVTGVSSGWRDRIIGPYDKKSPFHPESTPLLRKVVLNDQFVEVPNHFFDGASQLKVIVLPSTISCIGYGAFRGCSGIESIVLPDSLTKIDSRAFESCTGLRVIDFPYSLKEIDSEAFARCSELQVVKGLASVKYVYSNAFKGCKFDYDQYIKSFSCYSSGYIIEGIKKWQKKTEFETSTQYQERVTEENQQKKMQELYNEAFNSFTKKTPAKVSLGDYDADHELFTLKSNYGNKQVKVPMQEAPTFKEKFWRATIKPTYALVNGEVEIKNITVSLNGKQYITEMNNAVYTSNIAPVDLPKISLPASIVSSSSIIDNPQPSITIDHSIDQNIPTGSANNTNTFAVIIGNEKYQRVMAVPYANNDAKVFAEYCKKTLGLPEKNVRIYENATYGTMLGAMSDIQKIARAYKGDINVIFYYAGHGVPDEATGDAYLLPIDADGINMRICYPLNQLYKELGDLRVKSVTCFMDCCFSGAERGNGMVVAARGVAIKVKSDQPVGNTVVFTAATDKQTAFPYKEKGHGMFTYYLLKKLRDTKGDCTLGELGSYISDEVAKQAVVTNGKEQTPVVLTAAGMTANWKTMKLK